MRFCVDLWCVGICLGVRAKTSRTEIYHTWPPTPPPDLSETLPTMHASTDALASAHHQALHAPAGVGELATLDHFKTPTSYVYGGDSGDPDVYDAADATERTHAVTAQFGVGLLGRDHVN